MRVFYFLLAIFVGVGCAGEQGQKVGSERGACYGNDSCDEGLSCLSQVCVVAPASAANAAEAESVAQLQAQLTKLEEQLAAMEVGLAQALGAQDESHAHATTQTPKERLAADTETVRKDDTLDPFADRQQYLKDPFASKADPCGENPNRPECMLD